jgi:hypothetical protein
LVDETARRSTVRRLIQQNQHSEARRRQRVKDVVGALLVWRDDDDEGEIAEEKGEQSHAAIRLLRVQTRVAIRDDDERLSNEEEKCKVATRRAIEAREHVPDHLARSPAAHGFASNSIRIVTSAAATPHVGARQAAHRR